MTIDDLIKRKYELGYTNEMIAAKSGVPISTVNKIFSGATKRPRFNTLQSIQCVLFPEEHSPKEAALYKDIVHNLTLDYADRVEESVAFDEYRYGMPEEDHKASFEDVISRKKPGEFTIDDWLDLPEGSMMELINGVLFDRNTPTTRHQFIVTEMLTELNLELRANKDKHKDCLVLTAPTGVQPDPDDNKNGFIPDVLIVCDKDKYSGKEIIVGAPDFIAEVLSPSTEKYDRIVKLNKYWHCGVKEVWIINIEKEEIYVYMFNEGKAELSDYGFSDCIPLGISGGRVSIDFNSITTRMHSFFD